MALLAAAVAVGAGAGVVAGLLGVGGGIVMVPFLVLAADLSQQSANPTSLLVIVPAAAAGTLTLRRRGAADLGASLRIGAFGAAGAVAGSLIALAVPSDSLRLVFAGAVGLTGARMLLDGWRSARRC
jgi:uncharacterized membrane protein YfcA